MLLCYTQCLVHHTSPTLVCASAAIRCASVRERFAARLWGRAASIRHTLVKRDADTGS